MSRRVFVILAAMLLVAGLTWLLLPRRPSGPEGAQVAGGAGQQKSSQSATGASRDASPSRLPSKREEREIRPVLEDFKKVGVTVDADHVGSSSAEGNVRIRFPDGGGIEAESLQVTAEGNFVTHGAVAISTSEGDLIRSKGAVVIGLDEEKKMVSLKMDEDMSLTPAPESE